MRESIIQTGIKKYLETNGWMVIKLIQTSCNGIPDLLALKESRAVFIEVKQPGKKPNDLQRYRHEKLRKRGFEVIIAASVNDVDNFFSVFC
jgi:Holliday junction resolvase-like predicted endonuclease